MWQTRNRPCSLLGTFAAGGGVTISYRHRRDGTERCRIQTTHGLSLTSVGEGCGDYLPQARLILVVSNAPNVSMYFKGPLESPADYNVDYQISLCAPCRHTPITAKVRVDTCAAKKKKSLQQLVIDQNRPRILDTKTCRSGAFWCCCRRIPTLICILRGCTFLFLLWPLSYYCVSQYTVLRILVACLASCARAPNISALVKLLRTLSVPCILLFFIEGTLSPPLVS